MGVLLYTVTIVILYFHIYTNQIASSISPRIYHTHAHREIFYTVALYLEFSDSNKMLDCILSVIGVIIWFVSLIFQLTPLLRSRNEWRTLSLHMATEELSVQ